MTSNNLDITQMATAQADKVTPHNDATGELDSAITESLAVDMTSGSKTLTDDEYRRNRKFIVSNVTTTGRTLTVPAIKRQGGIVVQSDSGNTQDFDIVRGSTTLTLSSGQNIGIATDGTTNSLVEDWQYPPRKANFNERIDFSNGISFDSGTNILSDYERGSWTPVLFGSTTAGTPTGVFDGEYQEMGNKVDVWCRIDCSALGGLAGNVRISGLPFTVRNDTTTRGGISSGFTNGLGVSEIVIGGFFRKNTDEVWLFDTRKANTEVSDTDLAASFDCYFFGSYLKA